MGMVDRRRRARLRDPPSDEGSHGGYVVAMGRPGVRTSEFLVAVLNVIGQVIAALAGYVSDPTAVKLSVAGAAAYILSRGLAKYEPRGPGGAPPP